MPFDSAITRLGKNNESILTRLPLSERINTANADRTIFIADAAYEVVGIREAHSVVGGAAHTVTVEKLTGTQAPGAGAVLLTAALSTTGTINTVASGTLVATTATRFLAAGDRLAIRTAGTVGSLEGVVTVILRRV
jgi:hypothetical protein